MSLAVQHASIAAWQDEAHVDENRALLPREVRGRRADAGARCCDAPQPDAGFYLWAQVPASDGADVGSDTAFARDLFAATHVTVLPGQYLARDAHGVNPGRGYVRIALVPELERLRRGRPPHRRLLPRMAPSVSR